MKTRLLLYSILFLSLGVFANTSGSQKRGKDLMNRKQQIGFTQNKGQVTGENGMPLNNVLYTYTGNGMDVLLTTSGISYVFWEDSALNVLEKTKNGFERISGIAYNRTDMTLKGATIDKNKVLASKETNSIKATYYNASYINGITDIKTFQEIIIEEVYPGIDWVLYIDPASAYSFKYDFIVKPGADASLIKMVYEGSEISLDSNKLGINIKNSLGSIREGSLYSYQTNMKNKINSAYKLNNNEVSFELGEYDSNKNLTIDPPVIIWSTNYGGSSSDYLVDTAVDAEDNLYLYGKTRSITLPGIIGDATNMGMYDAFVTKFDTHGQLKWSAMFGGSGNDDIEGAIAVNKAGNEIYFCGAVPSTDFPIMYAEGAYNKDTFEGGNSGFVAKIDQDGALLWSTFIDGNAFDHLRGIAIDSNDRVYIMGFTSSSDFPVVAKSGAYNQSTRKGGINDGVLIELDENDQISWATYFGGDGADQMSAIKISPNNHLVMVGNTDSRDFPIVAKPGAYNNSTFSEFDEAQVVIMEFDTSQQLIWSTLFGGSNYEQARTLAWDSADNLYVIGETESPDMPVMELPGAYFSENLNNPVGAYLGDAFILRFDANSNIDWSTYYGGERGDLATAIEFDEQGRMWFGGATTSQDFPIVELEGAFNQAISQPGARVMFWAVFDTSKNLEWSTLYGSDDFGWNSGFLKRSNNRMLMFTQASTNNGLSSGIIAEDPLAYTQGNLNSNDIVILEFLTDETMGITDNDYDSSSMVIYPNPSRNDKITIQSNNRINSVQIANITGQIVSSVNCDTMELVLDVSHLDAGIYLVLAQTEVGKISKKIIITQ